MVDDELDEDGHKKKKKKRKEDDYLTRVINSAMPKQVKTTDWEIEFV